MKTFDSMEKFAKHLEKVVKSYSRYETKAANFVGLELAKEARDKIGHLQHGNLTETHAFFDWEPLADSTKADKERRGYVVNSDYNPLLRTGELRDSIKHDFNPITHKLRLGSDDEIMMYQELGTKYIPPRSTLGLTLSQAFPLVSYTFGSMLAAWLEGRTFTPRRLTHGSI